MLGSRCLAFSTSSSTLRCPTWAKKASTIKSRCRVVLRPRAAIQVASRSRAAAAVAGLRWSAARFILILILSIETDSTGRPDERQAPLQRIHPRRRANPPLAPTPPGGPPNPPPRLGTRPRVVLGQPHQRGMRPLPYAAVRVVEPID